MNCFCDMVDQRQVFSLIFSQDHCQRSSLTRISDTPQAGFGPAQNLSSGFHYTTAPKYNIQTIATGQGDNHTIGCLLDYPYFKNYYKMIAIDLSKQQELDANPKAIQLTNFSGI